MGRTLRRTGAWTGVLAVAIVSSALTTAPVGAAPPGTGGPGPPQARVVGGSEADIAEYPFTVFVAEQGSQFCGGTLAAPDKVVTAAHCVDSEQPENIEVVAGRQDTRADDGVVAEVGEIVTHPDYVSPDRGADIAVLTLEDALNQRTLDVATSADEALYRAGTPTTVLGWGATSEGGSPSTTLRKAHPPVAADANCAAANPGFSPDSMVCAGLPEGGVDACQGDSGGPLMAGDKLIGIVSWGNGCARPEKPGVYTRVSSYEDFLRQHVGDGDSAAAPAPGGPAPQSAELNES